MLCTFCNKKNPGLCRGGKERHPPVPIAYGLYRHNNVSFKDTQILLFTGARVFVVGVGEMQSDRHDIHHTQLESKKNPEASNQLISIAITKAKGGHVLVAELHDSFSLRTSIILL